MKRAAVVLLLIVFLIATGCASTYQLPDDIAQTDAAYVEDLQQIVDLLNDGHWNYDLTDCAADFTFYTKEQKITYHSHCGTFNDVTRRRSFTVSEEQRIAINEILTKHGLLNEAEAG